MKKFYTRIVNNPKKIIIIFLCAAVICAVLQNLVAVNYDMKDYLPEDSSSTVSLDLMNSEFDGGIPNARVMVRDVSIAQAMEYKDEIAGVDGVSEVTWLDDAVNIYQPLETLDNDTVETYYKDNCALFTVTIDEEKRIDAVADIREIIGDNNAMTGDAVSTAKATVSTVSEIKKITIFAVLTVLLVLLLTTTSRAEPFVILIGLGVAIMINNGTNLIFGEISFVTNAAGTVLQLAVSLDYSVFLIHRFDECLKTNHDKKSAMVEALCKSTSSILSSGLTTVIGFLALLFMRFGIGPDLGLALAKGIAISLIVVFIFMPPLVISMYPVMEKTRHRKLLPSFKAFGKFAGMVMIPVALVIAVAAVPCFLASSSNDYYFGSSHIFNEKTQAGRDAQQIEAVFGKSDTYVAMVPNGNLEKQKELSDELHSIDEVSSIISYVDTVGAEIPTEYLDEETLSMLVSNNYSRMVLTVDTDYEGESTFALVENLRKTIDKYYPGDSYLAGEGVSTYDLMDTITSDNFKVNAIAIAAVFCVLVFTTKSLSLPVILVLSIEAAIWMNLAIPYFCDAKVFYIAYLIISSIQLGATVDYAILFSERYSEFRRTTPKRKAAEKTVCAVMPSLLTSGTVLAVVGFLLSGISTHGILKQLGLYLGRGSLLSLFCVLLVLPGLLYIFDGVIRRTTKNANYLSKEKKK
ncbi:MAG: RND family transporter [Eubacterium sp.]